MAIDDDEDEEEASRDRKKLAVGDQRPQVRPCCSLLLQGHMDDVQNGLRTGRHFNVHERECWMLVHVHMCLCVACAAV